MKTETIDYLGEATTFYFGASWDLLHRLAPVEQSFLITDEHLHALYKRELEPWNVIVVAPGEESKSFETVVRIVQQLLSYEADRNALIVGVGGGVVCDLAGFVAGIYKRGLRFGLVPTSVLAMADAAVGGKNGINFGETKNCIGLIRQPEFLLYHFGVLRSLPKAEWINGFAEIIKHACIFPQGGFESLMRHSLEEWMSDDELIGNLIQKNALLKAKVVQEDPLEHGRRRILNFGHTLAHAIEKVHHLPHGHAVTIGIYFACLLSVERFRFSGLKEIENLIKRYDLPLFFPFNKTRALRLMLQDKKREKDQVSFILLKKIGDPHIVSVSLAELGSMIHSLSF